MPIERITADDLRGMEHQEGLVLQGCGGEAQEWLDGINDLLTQDGILQNGNRFETYTIAGEPGSGVMCLNGAAARQVQVGDHIILMCYASMTPDEAKEYTPKVVFVNNDNSISRITDYEKHGELFS